MSLEDEHNDHLDRKEFEPDCPECQKDIVSIDWLMAVRKYGLETANKMFP